jgi:ribosomal protein S18 acetylase RimI-like enzyme
MSPSPPAPPFLRQATSPADVETARSLFLEYQESLGISLCFQNFDAEVASLPGAYSPPEGRLLLAFVGDQPAGCVALRKLEDGIGEMKRLWVRPAFRGTRLGRRLAEAVLSEAGAAGYRAVRLDTLPSMREAQALYVSLGFADIPPYNDHPIEGTRFMEKRLA